MMGWKHSIPLGDVLGMDLEWGTVRDTVVGRIRAASLPDPDEELEWILDDLSMAPDERAAENEMWRLYNWADANRVWLDPIKEGVK